MISGGHRQSVVMRGIIAWLKMRIDDPHNGCWLPRDWGDRKFMPNYLRNAVPHKRIHTDLYYQWINGRIAPHTIKTPDQLINALRLIRAMLQSGNVPPGVISGTGK